MFGIDTIKYAACLIQSMRVTTTDYFMSFIVVFFFFFFIFFVFFVFFAFLTSNASTKLMKGKIAIEFCLHEEIISDISFSRHYMHNVRFECQMEMQKKKRCTSSWGKEEVENTHSSTDNSKG